MAKILRNSLRSNSVEFFNAIFPYSGAPPEAEESGAPRRIGGTPVFYFSLFTFHSKSL